MEATRQFSVADFTALQQERRGNRWKSSGLDFGEEAKPSDFRLSLRVMGNRHTEVLAHSHQAPLFLVGQAVVRHGFVEGLLENGDHLLLVDPLANCVSQAEALRDRLKVRLLCVREKPIIELPLESCAEEITQYFVLCVIRIAVI